MIILEQLIMRWKNDFLTAKLPEKENISTTRFCDTENALEKWLDIVQYGLSEKRESGEYYDRLMVNWPCYSDDKCFFVIENGVEVATITVVCNYETKEGYIHMVACKPECRGMGIGTFMNSFALCVLKAEGMETAYLTTDDWRIPAIKSYLRAGFVPDESTEDFRSRWEEIRKQLG